jgi:RNA polymerase sigma-70 factor (ECF subfamily)
LDAEAFDRLHREYGDHMIQSITGMVRDRGKAEDIAAHAFQKSWEKRGGFRGESLLSTWIETIARREALRFHDRERAVRLDSIGREDEREIAAPELVTDELEKRDDRLQLESALARLPDKFQRALTAIS